MSDFPTLDGTYRLSTYWEASLPGEFQRRFQEGTLVLWRPGLTARVDVRGNENDEPKETRARRLREDAGAEAFDAITETNGALIRCAYRRQDPRDEGRPAFHGFAIGNSGHVEMAVILGEEDDVETARQLWRGLREVEPPTGSCG